MSRNFSSFVYRDFFALLLCFFIPINVVSASGNHGVLFNTLSYEQAVAIQEQLEQEKKHLNIYKAFFPSKKVARNAVKTFHNQLLETHYDDGYLVLELTEQELIRLKTFDFKFEAADEYIAKRDAWINDRQSFYGNVLNNINNEASEILDVTIQGISGYSCYETVEETFAVAEDMVVQNPGLAEWIDVGDSWEKSNNAGGFDIYVLKLTNQASGSDKPVLFINSAIHAREYTTAPLTLDFARWLLEGYGNNADATWILDHHEVHLMLQTNPDGRKQAETGLSWRKNTNQNFCGAGSNRRGVDLNRNFSFTWDITSGQGSSGNACNATFRGPSAGSEPEVQAMENYIRSLWPDQRGPNRNDPAPDDTSGIHLDIHSFSELVLWPWGSTNAEAPNGAALQTLGRKFANYNGYSPEQSIGLYPTDGTSDAVSYGELGVAAYTFELGTSFFQSCNVYENTILPDNLPALVYAAKVVRTPYITPSGPDITSLSLSDSAETIGVLEGVQVTLSASSSDARFNNSNGTEPTQNIKAVEFYVDTPPWTDDAIATLGLVNDGEFNEVTETITGNIDTSGLSVGKHVVYVRAQDESNTWGAVSAIFLIIRDETQPIPTPTPIPIPVYCSASSDNASEEWISRVELGGSINSSQGSNYSDFTEENGGNVLTLNSGSNAIVLTPGFSGRSYPEYWRIWIDLNQDGDFSDSNELVFDADGTNSDTVTASLNIPSDSVVKTRLRVAMRYNRAPTACGNFNYGEVEDYTVNIVN